MKMEGKYVLFELEGNGLVEELFRNSYESIPIFRTPFVRVYLHTPLLLLNGLPKQTVQNLDIKLPQGVKRQFLGKCVIFPLDVY